MLWEHYYNDLTLDDFIKFYKNVQIEEPHWYGIVMTSYLYESLQSELNLIVTYSFDDLISWYGLHVLIFDEYCNAYNIQCAVVDENTYYEMCKVKNIQYCGADMREKEDEYCGTCRFELYCPEMCEGCCEWDSHYEPKDEVKLCRECEEYAGDGMYCASNYLVYDFDTCKDEPRTKRSG